MSIWYLFSMSLGFSPDGRYVVFELKSKEDPEKRNICLLATDGSREADWVEIETLADDWAPFWTPDGKRVVFDEEISINAVGDRDSALSFQAG